MKFTIPTTILISVLFIGSCHGQAVTNKPVMDQLKNNPAMDTDDFAYTFKSAHPRAQALMKDSFYWSPIEETAPFGSDDGFEAAYGFREWRTLNKTSSPVSYLDDLIASWRYPFFDYREMDTTKIKTYLTSKMEMDEATIQDQMQKMKDAIKNSPDTSAKIPDDKQLRDIINMSSKDMGGIFLLGQDNAIIGIGFSQFVLEGHVDKDIKALTIIAIKRQLLPLLINRYDADYSGRRKDQLTKMLAVINKA